MAKYYDLGGEAAIADGSYIPRDGLYPLGSIQFSDPQDGNTPFKYIFRDVEIPEEFYQLMKKNGMLRICIHVMQRNPDYFDGNSAKIMRMEFHVKKDIKEEDLPLPTMPTEPSARDKRGRPLYTKSELLALRFQETYIEDVFYYPTLDNDHYTHTAKKRDGNNLYSITTYDGIPVDNHFSVIIKLDDDRARRLGLSQSCGC